MKNPFARTPRIEIPRIEVFMRHCYYSSASAHKERLSLFSHERCYQNLLGTMDENIHITLFLDRAHVSQEKHFLHKQTRYPLIEIDAGTEALSFLKMLDYVLDCDFAPDTLIYFLEDDYLHKPQWPTILREGLLLPHVDYVTLFDHRDKYFAKEYINLSSQIFHTKSCHWRTTPSTTNTYAMRFKTLCKHEKIHRQFSQDRKITEDHKKFIALKELGATLVSSIPGWSTHVEPAFASPCTDWPLFL